MTNEPRIYLQRTGWSDRTIRRLKLFGISLEWHTGLTDTPYREDEYRRVQWGIWNRRSGWFLIDFNGNDEGPQFRAEWGDAYDDSDDEWEPNGVVKVLVA